MLLWIVLVAVVVSGAVLVTAWRRAGLKGWVIGAWGVVSVALVGLVAGPVEARKTMAALLMPAGLLWLGSGALAVGCRGSRRRRTAVLSGILFLALSLLGNRPLATLAASVLESRYPPVTVEEAGPFDAVAVLGGGLQVVPGGGIELGPQGERVALGARLFLAGRTPLLVATGPVVRRAGEGYSVAEATCRYWGSLGVPEEATVALTGPSCTKEEIAALARLVRKRGWRRIGLVTSAVHMPRAMRLAHRAALPATPLPADHLGAGDRFRLRSIVPSADGLAVSRAVWWELLGMAAGR